MVIQELNNMTNLQILLSVLSLEEELEKEAIIAYFSSQDSTEFEIDGEKYFLLTDTEIEDLLYDQYEDELYEFIEYVENFRGFPYYTIIDERGLIQTRVDKFEYKDLKDKLFIQQSGNFYIYKEY